MRIWSKFKCTGIRPSLGQNANKYKYLPCKHIIKFFCSKLPGSEEIILKSNFLLKLQLDSGQRTQESACEKTEYKKIVTTTYLQKEIIARWMQSISYLQALYLLLQATILCSKVSSWVNLTYDFRLVSFSFCYASSEIVYFTCGDLLMRASCNF